MSAQTLFTQRKNGVTDRTRFIHADSLCGYRPVKWGSVYIIPYNRLSWFLLGRMSIEISSLSLFDRALGTIYPFNRLGWNIMVSAEKVGGHGS